MTKASADADKFGAIEKRVHKEPTGHASLAMVDK
jgi:hypothetical protein